MKPREQNCTFVLLIALTLVGCGVTKGYPGPELPPEQVSRVFFSSQSPLSLSSKRIDAVSEGFFDQGIAVLPGEHTASMSVIGTDEEECGTNYCRETVERDKDGDVVSRTCECSQPCSQDKYSSNCSTSFATAAGVDYTIEVNPSYYVNPFSDRPKIAVRDQRTQTWIGEGVCAPFSFSYTYNFDKTSSNGYCW